jgi:hypothetical protein
VTAEIPAVLRRAYGGDAADGPAARGALLTVKIRQPSHEFTFGVGMSFIPYPLVLTPVVYQVHVCMSVLEFNVYAGF